MHHPILAFLVLVLPSTASALSATDYLSTFRGDGTYYGATEGGNCALRLPRPKMYAKMVPIAMNNRQYGDSGSCGACLRVTGTGRGSGANPIQGTFDAYVMDRCPECKYGDIDLSTNGDGRWLVSWKFIPCPKVQLSFLFEGSNRYFWKLQPRGLRSPARSVTIKGRHGVRTQDNFFEFHGANVFPRRATVSIVTVLGETHHVKLSGFVRDGIVLPV